MLAVLKRAAEVSIGAQSQGGQIPWGGVGRTLAPQVFDVLKRQIPGARVRFLAFQADFADQLLELFFTFPGESGRCKCRFLEWRIEHHIDN